MARSWYQRARVATQSVLESPGFAITIMTVIAVNAVTLGLETWPAVNGAVGPLLTAVDRIALVLFTLELTAKLWIYRRSFFGDGWNVFDFSIVALAWMSSTGSLSVLRTLRVLRVFRLLSAVPQMRTVIGALLGALPGMGSIVAVLLLIFYVAAVMTTKLFGVSFPEWFGSVGGSMYSLFQIMTLESWSMGIVRPVMEEYPLAWVFFVPFVIVTSFAVLNLFIALIVNSMQAMHTQDRDRAEATAALAHDERNLLLTEIAALRADIQRVEASIGERIDESSRPASANRHSASGKE